MEGANTNTAVLTTMGEAAKALKKAHADMDVDQVRSDICFAHFSFDVAEFPCGFSLLVLRLSLAFSET